MPMPTRRQWDAMVVSATTTTTSTRVMTGTGRWSVTPVRARDARPRPRARLARDDVAGGNPSIRARGRRSTRCRAERGNGDDGVETKDEESLSVVDRAPSRASIDAVRERARVSPSSARARPSLARLRASAPERPSARTPRRVPKRRARRDGRCRRHTARRDDGSSSRSRIQSTNERTNAIRVVASPHRARDAKEARG